MATLSAAYGLGLCAVLFANVDLPVSAVQDAVNDPSAAIARCVWLADEVLGLVARHHVAATPRDELEQSFRLALRQAKDESSSFVQLDWPQAISAWSNNGLDETSFRRSVNDWLQALPGGRSIVAVEEHRVARQLAANQYVGIGVALGTSNNELTIGQAFPDGPAERGGLERDDRILAIDGWSTEKQPLQQVLARIRGEPGSTVIITIVRNDKRRDVVITRDFIRFDSVSDLAQQPMMKQIPRPLKENGAVAGLHISRLTGATVSELRQWERTIRKDASKRAVIIDLRSIQHDQDVPNLATIADALIDGRTLWYELRNDNTPVAIPADRECLFRGMPLAVLVSDHTPTAGWILARALQAGRNAAIIHHQTWTISDDVETKLPKLRDREHAPESAALLLTEAFPIDGGRQVVHVATREVRFRESRGQLPVSETWKSLTPAPGTVAIAKQATVDRSPTAVLNPNPKSAAWTSAYQQIMADLNPGFAGNRQLDVPVELARDWLSKQIAVQERSP